MKLPKKLSLLNLILGVCIICAAFFYFWEVPKTLQFQGDQGRDALIVSDIFRTGNLVFIGPVTSVGNMYLGPLYYYFMLPFLFLTYPSPLGPVYGIGLLSLLSVFLLYYLGKKMVGQQAAIVATILFTFSSIVVTYSRFSWNPNPAPFVMLLMFYFTYQAWTKSPRYWLIVAVTFSILIQLHYLTLLTLAGAGIIWMLQFVELVKNKSSHLKTMMLSTLGSVGIFVTSLTPLILFDLKHDNLNFKALLKLLTQEPVFVGEKSSSIIENFFNIVLSFPDRLKQITFDQLFLNQWTTITSLLLLLELSWCAVIFNSLETKMKRIFIILLAFIFTTAIGISFYQSNVYSHYILYTIPVVVTFHGFLISTLRPKKLGLVVALIFITASIYINLKNMPFQPLDWQINDIRRTSESIHSRVKDGEKYNIVRLSGTRDIYAQNYRYFLSTMKNPPLPMERWGESETLFIINEEKEVDLVTELPIYEIMVFPDKDIDEEYTIDNGPEITVLRK